ncbi:MAG: MOP flippase family protein [Kiritimatiellae bacterium]|nr:MOP flippase family protein [Kiritimatiellia bacterium]
MSLKAQAAAGVKWKGLATVSNVLLHLAIMAILARLLAPGDFGLRGMALVVIGFAKAFADAGISNAIIHRQDATRRQLSSLYWLNLAAGFAVFVLVWLSAPLVVGFYQEPRLFPVVRWSAVVFLVQPIGQQFAVLLRRELQFRILAIVDMLGVFCGGVLTIVLAVAGLGVMSLVWGGLLGTVIHIAMIVGVAARRRWLPELHFSRSDLRGFVSFGVFQMSERCLNFLSANVDYLVIGRFLGAAPLGYYTLAYNLVSVPMRNINPLLTSVAFPAFARIQHDDARLRRGYARILEYLSTASFPLMGGLLVVAPLLVPVLYGPQWLPAVPVVQVLCLLGALKSLGNPIGSLLLAKGRADLGFYLNLIAVVGYAVSNMIGVRWGILGVAASSLIFLCVVMQPLSVSLCWHIVRMTVGEWLGAIRRAALAALIMILVIVPLRFVLPPGMGLVFQLALLVLVGASVYSALIWRFDRALLNEAWALLKTSSSEKQ